MYHPYSCVVSLLYLQMTITLPEEYPLGSVSVECGKRVGIKEDRWHRWVLQIRRLLSTHNGAVVDAIKLWKDNGASRALSVSSSSLASSFCFPTHSMCSLSLSLSCVRLASLPPLSSSAVDRELDGIEPCPICYSIVQPTHQTLPRVRCGVCHAVLHSACLYKWFKTSQKNSCPMCRSSAWVFK